MKLKLFLFLFFACTLLSARAMAQGCSTIPIPFPLVGTADIKVNSGACVANVDAGTTGQGGRLRWDNNNSHALELFDSDDSGQLLWCAGGNPNANCRSGNNAILCLQQDGNMVIYVPQANETTAIVCNRNAGDGGGGVAIWASNTQHANDGANNGTEQLLVEEDVFFCANNVCTTRTGDRAVIQTASGLQFVSLGYTD